MGAKQVDENGATTGRKMTTVNGKSAEGNGELGELNFVRFSELAKNGVTGLVASGIYEGSLPNRFDAEKLDFKIRSANGDLTIVNAAGSLQSQMAKVPTGTYVEIEYFGKVTMEEGKFKGKQTHKIIVLREDTSA